MSTQILFFGVSSHPLVWLIRNASPCFGRAAHFASLPTEAEWEFAARGGTRSRGYVYSGKNVLNLVAWFFNNSGFTTSPVARKQANELGLYYVSGNVWEWTSDLWSRDYNSPHNSSYRMFRSGSWDRSASCRSVADRDYDSPANRYIDLRLRLALEIAP